MDTRLCTLIKPTTFQHVKYNVGDEIELTESQARPLQNAGIVTLDDAAAKLIRVLVGKDETDTLASESPTVSENDNAATPLVTRPTALHYGDVVGVESGD